MCICLFRGKNHNWKSAEYLDKFEGYENYFKIFWSKLFLISRYNAEVLFSTVYRGGSYTIFEGFLSRIYLINMSRITIFKNYTAWNHFQWLFGFTFRFNFSRFMFVVCFLICNCFTFLRSENHCIILNLFWEHCYCYIH